MTRSTLALHDLDHVVLNDGRICRVVGNLDSATHFLGYNVYSPATDGDRLYRGRRYRKNYFEDNRLPVDVLDTYELISVADVAEDHDPVRSARSISTTVTSTIWFDLYAELVDVFGDDAVGIFGSSMFGLHLTPDGRVRKDVDFVIEGLVNVRLLRERLPKIRYKLGFTEVSEARQLRQYARYQKVFRNENNTIKPIIARRWTGLQLSEQVVTTIRLRDPMVSMSVELVSPYVEVDDDRVISGRVTSADGSNLFPRTFTVITQKGEAINVYILWWKFSTPVREGDEVTLCGSALAPNPRPAVRLTNFTRHWLRIAK